MNDPVVVAAAERTIRGWDVVRITVALLWPVAAALAWWTSPREQSFEQARAELAAGRVTAYQWGDAWDTGSRPLFDGALLRSSGPLGPLIAWRSPDGRVHWADTTTFGEVPTGAVDAAYAGPGAVAVAQDLRAAGLEGRAYREIESFRPALIGLEAVLTVVFLGLVVAGPAPVVGTRWFWFWLVTVAPYGLGLLFWLARERPWSRSAAGSGDPPKPRNGFLGLGLGILATFVVGVLLMILNYLLGDTWVPDPR